MSSNDASVDEWWWCRESKLVEIAASLQDTHCAIVDNFLPQHELDDVMGEVNVAHDSGILSQQGMTGGGKYGEALKDKTIRGDVYGFFDEDHWVCANTSASQETKKQYQLSRSLAKMNTVICEMRDLRLGSQPPAVASAVPVFELARRTQSELQPVRSRSRAMVTCYPGGDKTTSVATAAVGGEKGGGGSKDTTPNHGNGPCLGYTKHYDNAIGNGRKLTAILYLNNHWSDDMGGQLCMYPPTIGIGTHAKSTQATNTAVTAASSSGASSTTKEEEEEEEEEELAVERMKRTYGYKDRDKDNDGNDRSNYRRRNNNNPGRKTTISIRGTSKSDNRVIPNDSAKAVEEATAGKTKKKKHPPGPAVWMEIAPIANRLVLFWSDTRCPHAVAPCSFNRFAVTLWFLDPSESQKKPHNQQQEQQQQEEEEEKGKEKLKTPQRELPVVAGKEKPISYPSAVPPLPQRVHTTATANADSTHADLPQPPVTGSNTVDSAAESSAINSLVNSNTNISSNTTTTAIAATSASPVTTNATSAAASTALLSTGHELILIAPPLASLVNKCSSSDNDDRIVVAVQCKVQFPDQEAFAATTVDVRQVCSRCSGGQNETAQTKEINNDISGSSSSSSNPPDWPGINNLTIGRDSSGVEAEILLVSRDGEKICSSLLIPIQNPAALPMMEGNIPTVAPRHSLSVLENHHHHQQQQQQQQQQWQLLMDKTTAKYNKKKQILTITTYFKLLG